MVNSITLGILKPFEVNHVLFFSEIRVLPIIFSILSQKVLGDSESGRELALKVVTVYKMV